MLINSIQFYICRYHEIPVDVVMKTAYFSISPFLLQFVIGDGTVTNHDGKEYKNNELAANTQYRVAVAAKTEGVDSYAVTDYSAPIKTGIYAIFVLPTYTSAPLRYYCFNIFYFYFDVMSILLLHYVLKIN